MECRIGLQSLDGSCCGVYLLGGVWQVIIPVSHFFRDEFQIVNGIVVCEDVSQFLRLFYGKVTILAAELHLQSQLLGGCYHLAHPVHGKLAAFGLVVPYSLSPWDAEDGVVRILAQFFEEVPFVATVHHTVEEAPGIVHLACHILSVPLVGIAVDGKFVETHTHHVLQILAYLRNRIRGDVHAEVDMLTNASPPDVRRDDAVSSLHLLPIHTRGQDGTSNVEGNAQHLAEGVKGVQRSHSIRRGKREHVVLVELIAELPQFVHRRIVLVLYPQCLSLQRSDLLQLGGP